MSEENPYNFKKDYKGKTKPDVAVEIGEVLEFRAGRHISVARITTTGVWHLESLIYTLDDFAVDANGNVISEMRAKDALSKHMTGALEPGSLHLLKDPTPYTAKSKSEIVHWVLAVPRKKQGGPVNDNAGPFKFVAVYIPIPDAAKFQKISHRKEIDILKENMDYINNLSKYEQNLVCGRWWKLLGCRMLR